MSVLPSPIIVLLTAVVSGNTTREPELADNWQASQCCVVNINSSFFTEQMSERTLDYFLSRGQIRSKDAALIEWSHAANSKDRIAEALKEADLLMRDCHPKEPIMAHPPETDSDITLQEWLKEVVKHRKGIKLDFKSLEAVAPSMVLLKEVWDHLHGPVWLNADILPGPGGTAAPLDPQAFLDAIGTCSSHAVLSLGWTTGWTADTTNPAYSWDNICEMEEVCRTLKSPVTFPVRVALLAQSFCQLKWLLQKSDRYTLTVWTGQHDKFEVQDLLRYRQEFGKHKIYYDLPDPQRQWLPLLTLKPPVFSSPLV
ncbi:protein FAM151B isoform X2 [Lampris incognitus]|uniref:protein FAM151B isoform X2 n=1 Tax=Lampris incognitus TaxID=2546036 RepID=UPI0024B62BDD|nr:protein FAM151B isoform X2 [Lampris incognitus]